MQDTERNIRSMQNDMTKLNTLITKESGLRQALQQGTVLMESDFIQALKVSIPFTYLSIWLWKSVDALITSFPWSGKRQGISCQFKEILNCISTSVRSEVILIMARRCFCKRVPFWQRSPHFKNVLRRNWFLWLYCEGFVMNGQRKLLYDQSKVMLNKLGALRISAGSQYLFLYGRKLKENQSICRIKLTHWKKRRKDYSIV